MRAGKQARVLRIKPLKSLRLKPPRQSSINVISASTLCVAIPLLSWSGFIMHEAVLEVGSVAASKAFLVQVVTLSL
ncbi:MAG: hypothetical protein CVV51_12680, partial [Spirochaetae bacterium HGW-Spirochaetae-7]